MKCKCNGCERRYLGCHSSCEDYKQFKAKIAEEKRRQIYEKVVQGYSINEWEASILRGEIIE